MSTTNSIANQLLSDEIYVTFTGNVRKNWVEKIESMIEDYLLHFEGNNDQQIIFIINFLLSSWFTEIIETDEIRKSRVVYVFNQLLLRIEANNKTTTMVANPSSSSSSPVSSLPSIGSGDLFNRWLIYKLMEKFNIKIDEGKWSALSLQITLRSEEIGHEMIKLIEGSSSVDEEKLSCLVKSIVNQNPWLGELIINNLRNYPFLKLRSTSDNYYRKDLNQGHIIYQCLEEAITRNDYPLVYKLLNIIPDEQLNTDDVLTCLQKFIHLIWSKNYNAIDWDKFYCSIIGRPTDKLAKLVAILDWEERINGNGSDQLQSATPSTSILNNATSTPTPPKVAGESNVELRTSDLVSSSIPKIAKTSTSRSSLPDKPFESNSYPKLEKKLSWGYSHELTIPNNVLGQPGRLINVILDRETKEWDVTNCYLLATIEKKHFLLELLSSSMSHFNLIPDELKLLFLLEIIYNPSSSSSSPQVSSSLGTKVLPAPPSSLLTSLPYAENIFGAMEVSKAFDKLRELVNSFWFANTVDPKPFLYHVNVKLEWIFKCIDWCLKMNPNLKYWYNLDTIFKMLSQGSSPLSVFNKFGILNAALESDDSTVNQEILDLLSESGNQSERMIWYGYLAIKLTVMWIFDSDSNEEEILDLPNQISSLINKILPLSFRVEILENLFSLLFLTQRDVMDSLENDPDEDGYLDDLFTLQQTMSEDISVGADTSSTRIAPTAASSSTNLAPPSMSQQPNKDSATFMFPNNLVSDYLSLLKDCVLKAQANLFAFKRRLTDFKSNEISEKGLDDVFVESSIIGYDECKTRLRSLMDYINDSQWRYSVIEPAFVEHRITTSMKHSLTLIKGDSEETTDGEGQEMSTEAPTSTATTPTTPTATATTKTSTLIDPIEETSDAFSDPKGSDKKDEIFSSLIPCMLASPDQLLRYCLIENQIDRAKQVYKLFEESLVNTEEASELLITEKTAELTHKFKNYLNPSKRLTTSKLNETAARGLRASQIQSIIHEFLLDMNSKTSGMIDINRLLIDYSICTSYSFELSQIILENCVRTANLEPEWKNNGRPIEFLSRIASLLPIFKESVTFKTLNLSSLFSFCSDVNLFTNPKILIAEADRVNTIKRHLTELRSLLLNDPTNPTDPTTVSTPLADSRPLAIRYQKLISCFPSGRFNYLKALFYHVRKVSEALSEARKRSENFARAFVSADTSSLNPLTRHGTYFSVLYKSPSAILCSLVIKYGISPKVVDDLARDMKVDLLGTLCSVTCPRIPTTSKQDESSCDFTLVDSFHPALCELIQCYLTGSHSMESSVLIQNHFDDERTSQEEGEKSIIKNPELINYFRNKSWILVSLLKLMNLISTDKFDREHNSNMIMDLQSPLQKWLFLVKTTIGTNSREDPISLTALALYPRIPIHNSLVMRALEKCAINHDYIQIHRMLQLLDTKNGNSSLEALRTALLLKLTKETGDVKYALQMTCARTMRDLVVELIFNSSSYSDTNNAERALKSAISRAEKNPVQSESSLILNSLHSALDAVNIYAKIATLSGLKSWKDAYDNLTEVDILTILKSKKCYSLALSWDEAMKKNKALPAFAKLMESSTTDHELDNEVERLRLELMLLAYCEKSTPLLPSSPPSPSSTENHNGILSILSTVHRVGFDPCQLVEKVLSSVEDWDSKETLVKYLLQDERIQTQPDKVEHYNNYYLGINLIKTLSPDSRSHYEPLVVKPFLIVEQMLMNLEYEALEKCIRTQRLINCDHLIEIYARKAVDVEIVDNESVTGSDTTMISSSILTEIPGGIFTSPGHLFRMPASIPSKDQWIPDSRVSICMLCKLEKFSMFNRKHHCRRCGRVVCGTCSQKFLIIPEISDRQPVRVCDDCHSQMRAETAFSTRKESISSPSSSSSSSSNGDHSIQWALSPNELENESIRDEFYFESAPSSSLCLSLLKLHSDKKQCAKVIIDQLSRPLFEILSSNRVDYGLIINLIKSLLLSAKVAINDDESKFIVDIDFLLSRVDIVKMLVEGNCPQRDLITHVISKEDASLKLQEKLIEMERFDLAYHIATKYGINLKQIWKTWAMVCLKHCQFIEARKKFKPCFGSKSTNNMSDINSKLLTEIFDVFELIKDKVSSSSLRDRCKAIKSGQMGNLTLRSKRTTGSEEQSNSASALSSSTGGLPQVLIEEGLFYLENYGSKEDEIRFYVRFSLLKNAVTLFLSEPNYGALTNLFVTKLLLPCIHSGNFKKLLATFNSIDPTLAKSWKYWIAACKYFSANNFYHILHATQVFMGDYIRAAMTQINFYIYPRVNDYGALYGRLDHLYLAKQHCQDFLVNKGQLNKGCLAFSSQEVTRQIKVINLQIEITNKLFAKKSTLPAGLIDLSESKEPEAYRDSFRDTKGFISDNRSLINSGYFVPTLLDDNVISKTQVAVMVLLELGSTINEGFAIAQQIIRDQGLDASHIYRLSGKVLAQSAKVNLVQLVNQLVDCIRGYHDPSESPALCDDMILTTIRHCTEPQFSDQLIKMLNNDLNKIDAYIFTEKLKQAYLLAVRLNRNSDVRKILDASIRIKQDNLTKICQMWLDKNS